MHKRRPRHRARKILRVAIPLSFLAALVAGLLAYSLSSEQLKRRVTEALRKALQEDREFRLGTISFGLSQGIVIEGLELSAPPPFHRTDFLRIGRLRARPRLLSLLGGAPRFSSIEVEGCEIVLEYESAHGWNFARLTRPTEGTPSPLPDRITIRGCSLSACPACLAAFLGQEREDAIPRRMLDGEFEGSLVTEDGRTAFEGVLRHSVLARVEVRGSIASRGREIDLSLAAPRVSCADEIVAALPESLRRQVAPYEPACEASVRLALTLAPERKAALRLDGTFADGHMRIPDFPYRLHRIKGDFSFDGAKLSASNVLATVGEGKLSGSGHLILGPGGAVSAWAASGEIDRIEVDERLAAWLPEEGRKLFGQLNLRGEIGVAASISRQGDDASLAMSGKVILRGVDAAYFALPYPMRRVTGTLAYDGVELASEAPLTGSNGSTALTISGKCEPRPRGALDVRVSLVGLRLDRELRSYLPPGTRAAWDSFAVEGVADAAVELRRIPGEREIETRTTLEMPTRLEGSQGGGVRMAYRLFPYEIEKITGKLVIAKHEVQALDLAGYHGTTYVTCRTGYWRPGVPEPEYGFVFESPDLPVDADLVRALPPEERQVLRDFRFEGRVKPEVKLFRNESTRGVQLEIDAAITEGRIQHVRFPYPLRLRSGKIFIGPSFIRIENLTTDEPELSVCCRRGVIVDAGDERHYDLELAVEKLEPEARLIEALPAHVGMFLRNLAVRGTFDAPTISIQYTHQKRDPDRFDLTYNAELVTEDAAMNLGLKFRNIKGKASIMGKAGMDYPHKATGELELESLRFHRLKLTDILLRCTYGRRHAVLNDLADGKSAPDMPLLRRNELLSRFPDDGAATDAFQVWLDRATAYNGRVRGFLGVDVGKKKDLIGQVFVTNVDLRAASPDIFRTGQATGLASAIAFFSGAKNDLKTLVGDGQVMLREANLLKLPIFVSMFSLLKLQSVGVDYFHRVMTRFIIEAGKFKATARDAISMESEFMTLQGGGSVDFDLNLDLYLSLPSLGLPSIPVVSSILRRLLDNVMVFHVTGTLDEPNVAVVPIQDILSLFR